MEDAKPLEKAPAGAVESDPKGRYWRFEDVLGRGAFKTVFKAFDSREGIEVAWNKVPLTTTIDQRLMRKRLFSEIHVLKRLKHKNIMTFHDYWLDERTNTLNFITELFTHGSLKKFRARHKHLELKVLKKWAWQILQGLVYLHGHEPPIIHRDLKCDNILINGVTGDLKIGDLGLATLVNGLEAPLSVIGTPEFMAPEFYIEQYNEKVDVYAFGMLLLELVSMDYPYCECTNPAAIYKRVSQGVFPASIQKIRNAELRRFIELCIAYEPSERPEARKLLKHDFFDGIRKAVEPERMVVDETEPTTHGSDSGGSVDSARIALSRHGSAGVPSVTASESEIDDDNDQSVATSDGVKITIECSKVEGKPTLNFTLRYDRPGGVPKNIQFPFNTEHDTADQIVAELRAEGSTDLDMMITEEEASTIGHLIAAEVERCKWNNEGDLTAYVNVMRTNPCDTTDSPHHLVDVDARKALESQIDNMCQKVACSLSEDRVLRVLGQESCKLMKHVAADSSRRSMIPRPEQGIAEDDKLSESNVLFSGKEENPVVAPQVPCPPCVTEDSVGSSAIDIPQQKRRKSTSSMERSHSISSTHSDSQMHVPSEGQTSVNGRSIQRRVSGRHFLTEGRPSSGGATMRKSMSVNSSAALPKESPLKVRSPQSQVELSVFVVEPNPESDSPMTQGPEGGLETEAATEMRLGNKSSLISVVAVKPTSKKGPEGLMPTVPEVTTKRVKSKTPKAQKPDHSVAKSKADEWQWTLVNGPISGSRKKMMTATSRVQSGCVSPQNSVRRVDSVESAADHGGKSNASSQEHESNGKTEPSRVPVVQLSHLAESVGTASRQSSARIAESVEEIKPLSLQEQEQALQPVPTKRQGIIRTCIRQNSMSDMQLTTTPGKARPLTADTLEFHSALMAHPTQDCRSAYELWGWWEPEAIRAFRREDGAAIVAGPSFQTRTPGPWAQGSVFNEAKNSVDRMFNSCADLTRLIQDPKDISSRILCINAPGFDHSMQPSPSDAALAQLTPPQPFPNLPFPDNKRGMSLTEKKRIPRSTKAASGDLESWSAYPKSTSEFGDQKTQKSHSKEERRQKASENILKMQQQELAGLCVGASVGVASSKMRGGKSQGVRRSMNGS